MAGSGGRLDGASLARLRSRITSVLDEATAEVSEEAQLTTAPGAEVLVVDRAAWVAGNVRTLGGLFGDPGLSGAEAKIVALEGGAFLGLLSRAVLAQYDPFRDLLIVVYPNLGEMARGDGLRWLLFHEVTHLAQFRSAPWMSDRIVSLGRDLLFAERGEWLRETADRLRSALPQLVRWGRAALEGKAEGSPLLELLPDEQRDIVLHLHAMVTVLEGHATYLTDRIAERVIPTHEELKQVIEKRRKRPPVIKLLEAVAGIEMKRQQYVLGRGFCERVWERGGPQALAPFWAGPDAVPTLEELREPDRWLSRVGS